MGGYVISDSPVRMLLTLASRGYWGALFLALMCLTSAAVRWSVCPDFHYPTLQIAPDSEGYHVPAVNLAFTGTYLDCLQQGVQYDAYTLSMARNSAACASSRPTCARSPGYSLFLAAVYSVHGVNPGAVYRYQMIMAMLVAAALPAAGYRVCGWGGAFAGAIAAASLSLNPAAGYAVSHLLTECLTEFLVTMGLLCIVLGTNPRGFSSAFAGVLWAFATLTRPGFICIAVAYCILNVVRDRTRGVVFATALCLVVGSWSAWASWQSGKFVLLSGNTGGVLIAGIDPIRAAESRGLPIPAITEPALEKFWVEWPGADGNVGSYLSIAWRDPGMFMRVQLIKLRIALRHLPTGQIGLIVVGAAIAAFYQCGGSIGLIAERTDVADSLPLPLYGLFMTGLAASVIDSAYVQAMSIGVCMAFLFGRGLVISASRSPVTRADVFVSMLAGYLLMMLVSFGNPRFVRPLLPAFHLIACLAVPLSIALVAKASGGTPLSDCNRS